MLENLAEEIRKLRSELSKRLADLENRVKHLEETRDPSYMVELVWRVACIEASAQRLLSHARNTLTTLPQFEEELNNYFENLGEFVRLMKDKEIPVNWSLLERSTSMVLQAAREAGLPFRSIASSIIDKLDKDAVKVLSEEMIEKTYGLTDLEYWKGLLRRRHLV
ncbi:MAG: hypothetical protein J7K78_00155 [Thaumarchaeota archaeon]|nr:hypothetical protein [Nitrososphaerota archaeon]